MSFSKAIRAGILIVLVLSLVACAPSGASEVTPTVEATVAPTDTMEPPTETPAPTNTVAPTATGAATKAAANNAAGSAPAGDAPAGSATAGPAKSGAATSGGAASGGAATSGGAAASTGSGPADKYQYVSQTVADKIQVRPGATITVTWTVKNAGTAAWSTDYIFRYFSGVKAAKDFYNFSKIVAPEKTLDFTVSVVAPNEPGDYETWWKLTNAAGQNFGDINLLFTVTNTPNNSAKPTAKPSATTAP